MHERMIKCAQRLKTREHMFRDVHAVNNWDVDVEEKKGMDSHIKAAKWVVRICESE